MWVDGWLRLPSRVALLLGLGALSAAGARADTAECDPGSASTTGLGETAIRSEGGRVYLSENGGEFRQLQLPDSPEARRLLGLLRSTGRAATGATLRPVILAGDGGTGFHWSPIQRPPSSPKSGDATKASGEVPAARPQTPPPTPNAAERATKG
jgi:hypothetical protein